MMEQVAAWFRGRTQRERMLLQLAAVLTFAVLGPLWAFVSASNFRREAAAELSAARAIESQVRRIVAEGAGVPASADRSLKGVAEATAASLSLPVEAVQPIDAGRVRVVFRPTASGQIYQWMQAVMKRGLFVVSTRIERRDGAPDLVVAEFEIASAPQ